MAKKALSFRFPEEFVTFLRTWSFVTEKDQRILLEEAFGEYAERRPEVKEKVKRIMENLE
ncbi:hypothetical protein [Aneurinibacillus aneurinilyticus]|uniref:CopG family transcriptional regulator n=1 Tax=Aneurinibacillus aneurinilyticus ATCC 12856 TaxID=649747 RepID=U1WQK4_ANEAE|nr:hypothetical protein [Aneurinibacillus aneurinilyticus]ERI10874.1 hypothetical protein HMPREF0083_00986 [Aneurinibacillus aneurinilyticus ATCC 12856]MED0704967.1 hypothetical protein [Aneurinibacillus aneurinilyticus]MED0723107.1 hypothetical protein [Aneurinibacillus aneurinilyticus]MED0731488.1 hypothetical protein [Aneurinibacillus aneurinilyticus]MED0740111.1 hypothetical protein [Aneurinibacillus aneurinilyticus]